MTYVCEKVNEESSADSGSLGSVSGSVSDNESKSVSNSSQSTIKVPGFKYYLDKEKIVITKTKRFIKILDEVKVQVTISLLGCKKFDITYGVSISVFNQSEVD